MYAQKRTSSDTTGMSAKCHNRTGAEPFRQPLRDEPCTDVEWAASGIAYENPHRPRRIGLRQDMARGKQERNGARCQMEELAAAKSHGFVDTFAKSVHAAAAGANGARNATYTRVKRQLRCPASDNG